MSRKKKSSGKFIIGLILVLLVVVAAYGLFQTGFGSGEKRSIIFQLNHNVVGYDSTGNPIIEDDTSFELGDFSFGLGMPIYKGDITFELEGGITEYNFTNIDCQNSYCNTQDWYFPATMDDGEGNVQTFDLQLGQEYPINDWVTIKCTGIVNSPGDRFQEIPEVNTSTGETIYPSEREYKMDCVMSFRRGFMSVTKVDISDLEGAVPGDLVQVPIILTNNIWGGFEGRMAMVETSTFIASQSLQNIHESEIKDIQSGENIFIMEVPIDFFEGVNVDLYPILDADGAIVNALVADDASRFNYNTGEFEVTSEPTEYLGQPNLVGGDVTPEPQTPEIGEISTGFLGFNYLPWIAIIVMLLLIIGTIILFKKSKKKKTRNFIIFGIIGVGLLVFVLLYGGLMTALPSGETAADITRNLQLDGWRLYEPLLYLGTPLDETQTNATLSLPNGGVFDALQCRNDISSSGFVTEYCESPKFIKTREEGAEFHIGGGDIYMTSTGEANTALIAKDITQYDISDFRYDLHMWKRMLGATIRVSETHVIHKNYVTGMVELDGLSTGIGVFDPYEIEIARTSYTERPIIVRNIMFKKLFNCKAEPDDALVFQTFQERQNVNIDTFFERPTRFCTENPTVIIDELTGDQRNDVDIVKGLINRETLRVPADQTWIVYFYINGTEAGVPSSCPIWNLKQNHCSAPSTTPSTPSEEPSEDPTEEPSGEPSEQPTTVETEDGQLVEFTEQSGIIGFINNHPIWAGLIAIVLLILLTSLIVFLFKRKRRRK